MAANSSSPGCVGSGPSPCPRRSRWPGVRVTTSTSSAACWSSLVRERYPAGKDPASSSPTRPPSARRLAPDRADSVLVVLGQRQCLAAQRNVQRSKPRLSRQGHRRWDRAGGLAQYLRAIAPIAAARHLLPFSSAEDRVRKVLETRPQDELRRFVRLLPPAAQPQGCVAPYTTFGRVVSPIGTSRTPLSLPCSPALGRRDADRFRVQTYGALRQKARAARSASGSGPRRVHGKSSGISIP
jgi:hypothetical protein